MASVSLLTFFRSVAAYQDIVGRHCPSITIADDATDDELERAYSDCLFHEYSRVADEWASAGVAAATVVLPTQDITADLYTTTLPEVVRTIVESVPRCSHDDVEADADSTEVPNIGRKEDVFADLTEEVLETVEGDEGS